MAPGSHLSTRKKPKERSKQEKRVRWVVLAHAEAPQYSRRHTWILAWAEVPTVGRGFQYRDLLHKRRKTCPPVVVGPQCLAHVGGWCLSHFTCTVVARRSVSEGHVQGSMGREVRARSNGTSRLS